MFMEWRPCLIFSICAAHTSRRPHHHTCATAQCLSTCRLCQQGNTGSSSPSLQDQRDRTTLDLVTRGVESLTCKNGFLAFCFCPGKGCLLPLWAEKQKCSHQQSHPAHPDLHLPEREGQSLVPPREGGWYASTDAGSGSLSFLSCRGIRSLEGRNLKLTVVKPETSPLASGLQMEGV